MTPLAEQLAQGRRAIRDLGDASTELEYSDAAGRLARAFEEIDRLLSDDA